MAQSRRKFLAGSAAVAAIGATSVGRAASPSDSSGSSYSKLAAEIVGLFEPLPGTKSIKIRSPATHNRREFAAELDPGLPLFCGSSFKAFVLGEALRQNEASNGNLTVTQLKLDESIWSLDSAVFNPPYLSGLVSERTALEAMVSHSDNTGADMVLKHIGADSVRSFIAGIGLRSTRIPNSTRQFLGYVYGIPDWEQTTWAEAVAEAQGSGPLAHPPINDVQTMVSSANDFVSFYSRGLQGAFFKNAATLAEFRAILMIADAIPEVVPLGATGFAKGGQINAGGFNGLCLAGGMYFPDRWVYFATMINWEAADPGPITSAFEMAIGQAFTRVKEALGA
jgi:beta-lactamase class A